MLGPPIVAESLIAVPDPLVTALRPGPAAAGSEVARALAASLRPDEDSTEAPSWLLAHQVIGFRRVLAALRRYGGALLADPVGSGKTYVALAVASALSRKPVACLVPATLVAQWRATAAGVGVPISIGSHQQASRGRLPQSDRGPVIIDESHHFRHTRTKRYRHVAPWLVGRPTLLLTATPIVNRLSDLAAQLLLAVPDDALVQDGVVSLRTLLAAGRSSPAFGRLVFERDPVDGRPRRVERASAASPHESAAVSARLAATDRLRLSRHAPIAALVRSALAGAVASSPAALAAALRQYRTLLLHARDAAAAGRRVDRALVRRFTEGHEDQLVLWEILTDDVAPADLELTDLEEIGALIGEADRATRQLDPKLERLRALVADGRPTLVFTSRRATVRHLRDTLGGPRIAWCTGARAGIGPVPMSRELVWRWFGRDAPATTGAPCVLVTTDVAAEGLDLRRVERVVHYDLPYTPMRLEQREGRAIRLGSTNGVVDVVRFVPPRPLERRLRQAAALARKAGLPAAAGLGPGGRELWRWRGELAERYGQGSGIAGVACVPAARAGLLAGFSIDGVAASVLWRDRRTGMGAGDWTDEPAVVSERLAHAAASEAIGSVSPDALHEALADVAGAIRRRLAAAAGRRWELSEPGIAARALAARLQQYVVAAARSRDVAGLRRLERALQFLAHGHTAGEEILIEQMTAQDDAELATAIGRLLLPSRATGSLHVQLLGLILFEPRP